MGETENARAKAGKCKQGQMGRDEVGGFEVEEAGGVLQGTGPAEVVGPGLWGKLILGSLSRRVHGNVHFRKILRLLSGGWVVMGRGGEEGGLQGRK